ncbi:MAG: hypothetical protein RJA20_2172 [Bacteroidota bacterium]|jgi:hypothetical protein
MTTLLPALLRSQVLVGGGTPDGSAVLELQSVTGGVLLPRMTRTQRVAIFSPATGLMLYNTTSKCLEVNVGTPTAAEWARANCLSGSITTLDCSNAVVTGTLTSGQVASGVSASIPFTGGNGGVLEIQTVASSGVTGLTAVLSAGIQASVAGNLTYSITGTPASGGTASFALSIGGEACTLNVFVCSTGCCAKVNATDYKNFMCHNLGSPAPVPIRLPRAGRLTMATGLPGEPPGIQLLAYIRNIYRYFIFMCARFPPSILMIQKAV